MKHAELIARLEAAEVGSRELDINLALETEHPYGFDTPEDEDNCPHFTASIDCALALAVGLFGERYAASMLFIVAGSGDDIKRFPTRICAAILRALDTQEQKG